MRLRTCVGTLLLVSLTACGGRATGGFHPSGHTGATESPATLPGGAAPAGAGGSGAAGAAAGGGISGAGGPVPRSPQSALAVYRTYQRMYEQAYENNDASGLDAVATDPLLSIITRNITKARQQGFVLRFHNVLNPEIQGHSADDSIVVILDCVRTLGLYRYSAKTGKLLAAERDDGHLYQAIMRYAEGTYKISDAKQGRKC